MTYSVLRRSNENHDIFYCVGINDEPMTNPTHSPLAAKQAKAICEKYKLQGQYSKEKQKLNAKIQKTTPLKILMAN